MARRKNASYILDVERRGLGDGGYEIRCPMCGKWFTSERYDATFCSNTCRSRYHRSLGLTQKRIDAAQAAVYELIANLPTRGASKTAQALAAIYRQIGAALESVESDPDIDPDTPIAWRVQVPSKWRCLNCGQTYFGKKEPEKCAFCGSEHTYIPIKPDQTDIDPMR